MKTIIALMNAYSQGKSGSDVAFIKIAKRMPNFAKIVVTSQLGKKLCQEMGLKADFKITTQEKEFKNIYLIYLKRIVKALFLKIEVPPESILYATSDHLPDVLPTLFLKLKNPKAKWLQKTFHLIPKKRRIPYYGQKLSYFLIKKFANLIIVDNKILKEQLLKQGFKRETVKINYLGIEMNYFQKLKADQKRSYEGIFLARLHQSKGVFDLVNIWKKVCRRFPKARLGVIGKGSKKIQDRLREQIKSNNLEKNIDILGYLSNGEAFSIIKASKLFVFPSHEEGFGMAILEAMACGVPVVAYDLSVYQDTFKKAIATVPCFDKNLYAKRIGELLGNKTKYQNQRQKALELIKDFTLEKTVKRELKYFNDLLR